MKRTVGVLGVLALGVVVLLAVLGVRTDGGRVSPNDWTVDGVSADGRTLEVSTFFGGVASDCTRFDSWEVVETDDRVEITANLWRRIAPSSCTDDGAQERLSIELTEPLGGRPLVGCGQDDCLDLESRFGGIIPEVQAIAGGALVVRGNFDDPEVIRFDSVGTRFPAAIELGSFPRFRAAGGDDQVFLAAQDNADAVVFDSLSGAVVWRAGGSVVGASEGVVYLCRGDEEIATLVAVEVPSGAERWATEVPCTEPVLHDEVLHLVTFDPAVDGGHLLAVIEADTGEVRSLEPIDDGIDDQVTGLDGAIRVGDLTVTGGVQANLIILDREGTEVFRQADGFGTPLGSMGDVALFIAYDELIGFDLTTREVIWRSSVANLEDVVAEGGSAWQRDGSMVSRLDPETGQPIWTTDVGRTSGFDVSSAAGIAYVTTTVSIVAIDNGTGAVLWNETI